MASETRHRKLKNVSNNSNDSIEVAELNNETENTDKSMVEENSVSADNLSAKILIEKKIYRKTVDFLVDLFNKTLVREESSETESEERIKSAAKKKQVRNRFMFRSKKIIKKFKENKKLRDFKKKK